MADANTAVIVLACVQGVATLTLAGITLFYARTTTRISEDTRRQADASLEMAREMREQRLARVQALILPYGARHTLHPSQVNVGLRLMNEGSGPAMHVRRVVKHRCIFNGSGEDVRHWQAIVEPTCDDGFVLMRDLPCDPASGTVRVEWADIYGHPRWSELPFTARLEGERVIIEWGQLELSTVEGRGAGA